MTLFCKENIIAKYRQEKTGWQIWQNLLTKSVAKKGCFADDDDMESHPTRRYH
jgi:hypothetical protein